MQVGVSSSFVRVLKRNILRFLNRIFLWLRIIRCFRGLTLRSSFNLILSSIFDSLISLFTNPLNPRLICSGIYVCKCNDEFVVYVRGSTDDLYFLLPGREGSVDRLIQALLKKGDVFIDVGANVGYYTLIAAKRGCRVIAVEPVPETAAVLRINLKLNHLDNMVHVVEKCLYKTDGKISINIPLSGHYGLVSIYHNVVGNARSINVLCTTLDSLTKPFDKIKLVKIDAEGAEYDILLGGVNSLSKIEHLIIEASKNIRETIELLKRNSFQIKPLGFTTYIWARRKHSPSFQSI